MLSKCFSLLMFFGLLAVSSYAVGAQETANNQSTEKIITRMRFPPETPVMIGAVKVSDIATHFSSTPVKIDDPDWLQHLSFKAKNLTRKKIVFIRFSILFPETAVGGQNVMAFQKSLGTFPAFTRDGKPINLGTSIGGKPATAIALESFNELDVSLADNYASLVRFIETRMPVSNINRIQVGVVSVGFDDGTYWNPCGGEQCYFKFDAEHPGQQIKLPNPELISFPGNSL